MGVDKAKLRMLAEQATPGPWRWDVNTGCHSVYLETVHSGRIYVMGFRRWGTQGAKPVFQRDGLIAGVEEFAVPRAKHHPDFDMDIDHPDAQLIAAANPATIIGLLDEIERLEKLEKLRIYCEKVACECNKDKHCQISIRVKSWNGKPVCTTYFDEWEGE